MFKIFAGAYSRRPAFAALSVGVILALALSPEALLAQSKTAAPDPAAWNARLEIGPIDGFTTDWHQAPRRTAVPLGASIPIRVKVPTSVSVVWSGAAETRRQNGYSTAELRANTVGSYSVKVSFLDTSGEAVEETSVFEVVDTSLHPVTLSAVHFHADDLKIDASNPNASTMHYYFLGSSIARLRQTGPDRYRTSTSRWLTLRTEVTPSEFSNLIEWRLDGKAQRQLGAVVQMQVFTAGIHALNAGPTAIEREAKLETYMVRIVNPERIYEVATGVPVTFTAETDPPGYEEEITWIASTKLGSSTPMTGEGRSFTTTFNQAVNRGGSWLGVKADGATAGIDPAGAPCLSSGYLQFPSAFIADSNILNGRFECSSSSCAVELLGVSPSGGPLGTVQIEKCQPLGGSFDCVRSVLQLPSGDSVALTLEPSGLTRRHSLRTCTAGSSVPICSDLSVVSVCSGDCTPTAWMLDGQPVSEGVFRERLASLLSSSPEIGIPLQVIPRIAAQVSPDVEIVARLAPALTANRQTGNCGTPGSIASGLIDCYKDSASQCGCTSTGSTCTTIAVSCPTKGTTGCFVISGTGCGVAHPWDLFGCAFALIF